MKQNILLIEDSPEYQLITKNVLVSDNYNLVISGSVRQSYEVLASTEVHLILLDIGLPDGDGFEFCEKLQSDLKYKQIPVIFLTGKADPKDKVSAFAMGAEDYIVKPFEPSELRARVEAKLRKNAGQIQNENCLYKGSLAFFPVSQRVTLTLGAIEQDLQLTPREFKIFYYLAKNECDVFTREQILHSVWGANENVLDRTVDTHIGGIRKKLGDHSRYISSVSGEGYSFNSEPQALKFVLS